MFASMKTENAQRLPDMTLEHEYESTSGHSVLHTIHKKVSDLQTIFGSFGQGSECPSCARRKRLIVRLSSNI